MCGIFPVNPEVIEADVLYTTFDHHDNIRKSLTIYYTPQTRGRLFFEAKAMAAGEATSVVPDDGVRASGLRIDGKFDHEVGRAGVRDDDQADHCCHTSAAAFSSR